MCTMCVSNVHGDQEKALETLELKFLMAVRHYVGSGNQTLCKSNTYSKPLIHFFRNYRSCYKWKMFGIICTLCAVLYWFL